MVDDKETGDSSKEGSNAEIKVSVDGEDKTLKVGDVENLIAQQSSATQKTQDAATLLAVCEKYQCTPEELVHNMEGSFAVTSKLIEDGVIDQQGNVLEKKETEPTSDDDTKTQLVKKGETESAAEIALKKMTEDKTELLGRLERVEKDQTVLIRRGIEGEMLGKFPTLTKDDVTQVFGAAYSDKSKSLEEHAEARVEAKVVEKRTLLEEAAKEHGVDLEAWEAQNKLKQQGSEGGASKVLGEKKVKFSGRPKVKGEDTVSPGEATDEFIKSQT